MGVTLDNDAAKKFIQKYIKCCPRCEDPHIRMGRPAQSNKYAKWKIVDTFTTWNRQAVSVLKFLR